MRTKTSRPHVQAHGGWPRSSNVCWSADLKGQQLVISAWNRHDTADTNEKGPVISHSTYFSRTVVVPPGVRPKVQSVTTFSRSGLWAFLEGFRLAFRNVWLWTSLQAAVGHVATTIGS